MQNLKEKHFQLILLGAPGSGKGTQASRMVEDLGIPHISTGDIFRRHISNGTPLGVQVKDYLDKGLLVPDSLTVEVVDSKLKECKDGFILDGFPRNVAQAEALDKLTNIDKVLYFDVDNASVISRLSSRRVCKCGKTHTAKDNTVLEMDCDCGLKATQRTDDKPETVAARLELYDKETKPLIDYYKKSGKLVQVDAMQSIEVVFENVLKAL